MSSEARVQYAIVLFDGVCNFCNSSVNFIIEHDRRDLFRFAPLQSDAGAGLQARFGLDANALDTLILIEDGKAFTKSTAALRIARRLGGLYRVAYVFTVIPRPIRDFFYDRFARRRYRWFGKRDKCIAPAPEVRSKFLSD